MVTIFFIMVGGTGVAIVLALVAGALAARKESGGAAVGTFFAVSLFVFMVIELLLYFIFVVVVGDTTGLNH